MKNALAALLLSIATLAQQPVFNQPQPLPAQRQKFYLDGYPVKGKHFRLLLDPTRAADTVNHCFDLVYAHSRVHQGFCTMQPHLPLSGGGRIHSPYPGVTLSILEK